MNKIFVTFTCLVAFGGVFYFYVLGHKNLLPEAPRDQIHDVVSSKSTFIIESGKTLSQQITKQIATTADAQDKKNSAVQQQNLENIVTQKYAILFSVLKLSVQTQKDMRAQLFLREQLLSSSFYDARSNETEIAANLSKREEDVAKIDKNIDSLLSEEDVKKYNLLKDSTYEQAQMNNFYELANAEHSLSMDDKNKLLLAKLEQKQSITSLLKDADSNIKNAAPGTRSYLIEKTHQALVSEQESYLQAAKNLLNAEQFDVLQDYEQQLLNDRWQDINASFASQ